MRVVCSLCNADWYGCWIGKIAVELFLPGSPAVWRSELIGRRWARIQALLQSVWVI
jgi:hypothetical protein